MAKRIEIQYEPRNWAQLFHRACVRWIVLVIHRRGGKTTAAFNHLQRDAMMAPNTRYAYVAPTFKQAKRIVWGMAKFYARDIPGVVFNESELLIKYPTGSEIMVVGSDNPDSLRGIALWGCFLDEYPLQSPIIFTEIISKCLADHLGYCIFGGTPKGKGHFHKIYNVALRTPDEYALVYRTIDQSLRDETGAVIENLRTALEDDRKLVKQGIMTEEEFQQEWYCSFEAAIPGAVYLKQLTKMREDNRLKSKIYDDSLPVHTVWDLGINDAMAIGFYQKVGREIRKIDYYENTGLGLKHYIKVVKDKPYIYGKHFAPHDIKKRELSTGKTLLDSARVFGIEFEVVPSIPLEDGIDLARSAMSRLWVDKDTCEIWLDFIGQYHRKFDINKGILKKEPEHDFTSHAADEWRYAAIVEDEMSSPDEIKAQPKQAQAQPDDEYVGHVDADDDEDGSGRHPMFKNMDIGKMGHR